MKIDNLCRSFIAIEVDSNSTKENPRIRNKLGTCNRNYDRLIRDGFIVINVNGKYGHANAYCLSSIRSRFRA